MSDSRAVRFHHGDTSLKKNKKGEIVSAVKSKQEKKNPWIKAVEKAKKELGIKGFALVQGPLLAKAREIYSK